MTGGPIHSTLTAGSWRLVGRAARSVGAGSGGTKRAGTTDSGVTIRPDPAGPCKRIRDGTAGIGAGGFIELAAAEETTGGGSEVDLKAVTLMDPGGSGRSSAGPTSTGLAAGNVPAVTPGRPEP